MSRLNAARVAAVVGALGVVAGAFLPWIVSGQATRNSFTTVRTARALALVDNRALDVLLAAWYLVPMAAAAVLLLAALGRRRSLAALSTVLGGAAVGFASFVRAAPIESSVGPPVCLASGVATLAAALVLVLPSSRKPTGSAPDPPLP